MGGYVSGDLVSEGKENTFLNNFTYLMIQTASRMKLY